MNINPVFEKEIKRHTRSIKISWIVCASNLVLGAIAITCFFGESSALGYMTAASYAMPVRCYMMMAYALFTMILIAVPAITAGSISLEREQKTLDILLTTNLNPWRIIYGKLESALSVVFLLTFSALPAIALVFAFGGVRFSDLLMLLLILLLTGIYLGSLGICCSVIFKKTTIATVMSYVFTMILLAGTVMAAGMGFYVSKIQGAGQMMGTGPSAGAAIYLLLLNPLASFVGLISQQIGSGHEIVTICNQFGNYHQNFVVNHMVIFSVSIQLGVSMVFLIIAGRKINPLHK